ncbi:MAG TPA: flavodoxin family protein [Firmicutes bacterium]|nr:flavodoxin family protein [Bacillota bacterium]
MTTLLAISSTPRRGGNSEAALHSFCRAAEENNISVEIVRLQELRLEPCRGCERCEADGICVIKDRMVPLYQKVAAVDGLVLATPIYFGSLAAQLKIFMDRFQCWWQAKYRLKKPFVELAQNKAGFVLCTGALHRKDFGDNVEAVSRVFFHSINYHFGGFLCLQGLDRKGEIEKDTAALLAAYEAGKKFVSTYLL